MAEKGTSKTEAANLARKETGPVDTKVRQLQGKVAQMQSSIDPQGFLSMVTVGTGSPEGVLAKPRGHIFIATDGGIGSTFFVKETGTGNTGWTGK